MQGFFFLTKLVEQQCGVDHVGTMQQWEARMATTSMWRVSCVFLLLLLALPTKARILCLDSL
jgi:hypothetical protein